MPPAAITKILEAARWAPSSNNSQPWSFVVVRDRKTISKLMQTCHYGAFYYDPTVLVAVVLEPVSESQKGLQVYGDQPLFEEEEAEKTRR